MRIRLREKALKAAICKVYGILLSHDIKEIDEVKFGIDAESIVLEFKAESKLPVYYISMK